MHNRKLHGLMLVFALSVAPDVNAQQKDRGAKPWGRQQEGIQVHGHWTIEVRNPDGRLLTHREFENSLDVQTGAPGLANVLGRVHTVGLWEVDVGNSPNQTTQPCQVSNLMLGCIISESSDTSNSNPNVFHNLTVNVPTSGNNAGNLVLNGSFTVQNVSPLAAVSTAFFYCPATVAPASCLPVANQLNNFTFFTATFFSPMNVTAGQLVQVTVVISFS